MCRNCCAYFTDSENPYKKHIGYCYENTPQKIKIPSNNILEFKKHYMKSKIPFYIIADFESTNKWISNKKIKKYRTR